MARCHVEEKTDVAVTRVQRKLPGRQGQSSIRRLGRQLAAVQHSYSLAGRLHRGQLGSLLGCMALGMLAVDGVQAKEGGDQYPNGAETWLAGALPPEGHYFINYTGHYGGELHDGSGSKVSGGKVSAWFTAMRYVRMTDKKILGGDYGYQLIVPVADQTLRLGGKSRSRTALGDITINPFILAWHRENLHWAIGLDINLPTGAYDSKDGRRSIGANYWSFEPLLAVTWLSDEGWEASAKFMYNIKTTNKDYRPAPDARKVDYESGDEFHMDYLLGKRFGQWGVGMSGYYLQQTTSDKVDGSTIAASPAWSKGRKGRVFAYGPTLSYTTTSGTLLSAQWNHESKVKNRFGGDKLMLKLITSF